MTELTVCSVCKIAIAENYCSRCGQRASGQKTTTTQLLSDLLANVFSLEKSAFATIFKILANPRHIVNNYHSGYKNYYSSPGKILLYSIAIIALHLVLVNSEILGITIEIENIKAQYIFWFMHLPIVLTVSYLTFYKLKENFSKHLISIIYISGSSLIVFTVINDILIVFADDLIGNSIFIFFIAFTFISNSRVFTKVGNVRNMFWNTLIQLGIWVSIVFLLIAGSSQFANQ